MLNLPILRYRMSRVLIPRRLLRDKIAAHDIQFGGGGMDLGYDLRDDV